MTGQDETAGDLLEWGRQRLAAAGIAQPRREVRLLMGYARGQATAAPVPRDARMPAQATEYTVFRVMVERRAGREPLAHITGRQGFWTLDLHVSDATLIPRADSEALVECLLALHPDRGRTLRMLDLGTGTGCLLLAALSEYPAAFGVGIDLAPKACALAASNASANGLAGRCAFVCGAWSDPLAASMQQFDVVLSNPPYIRTGELPALMPEVGRFEPLLALDGGDDGLDAYRSILGRLPGLLGDAGVAILELGAGQLEALSGMAVRSGLEVVSVRADLGGIARALAIRPRVDGQKLFGRSLRPG